MLLRIRLRNFKAHANLDLSNLAPISIIVGPNNVGKSAILQAAAVPRYGLSSSQELPIGDRSVVPRSGAPAAEVDLWFDGPSDPLSFRVVRNGPIENALIGLPSGARRQEWMSQSVQRGTQEGLWYRRFPGPFPELYELAYVEELRRTTYLSALRGLPESFNHHPLDDDVGPRGENSGNIINNLIQRRDPRFKAIEGWVGQLGLRVSEINSETIAPGTGSTNYRVGATETDPMYVGSGTLAVVPILVQGLMCRSGQTLLLEEPETHLHRGAMNGLATFFADCAGRGVQVVMTSHSFDFLEAVHRRVASGQVDDDKVGIYNLSAPTDDATEYELVRPSQVLDLKDRIVGSLATT